MSPTVRATLCIVMFACPAGVSAQEAVATQQAVKSEPTDFLKALPADAGIVFAIPNQPRLIERARPIFNELNANSFLTPDAAATFVLGVLGLTAIDQEGPLMLVLSADKPEQQVAAGGIYKDSKQKLGQLGLTIDEMKEGKPYEIGSPRNGGLFRGESKYGIVVGKRLWISDDENILERIAKSESVHDRLSADQRHELADVDFLIHVDQKVMNVGRELEGFIKRYFGFDDEIQENVELVAKHLDHFQFSMTLKDGVRSRLSMRLDGHEEGDLALTRLVGPGQSRLTGLPEGRAIAVNANMSQGDGSGPIISELTAFGLGLWGSGLRGFQSDIVGSLFSAMISKLENSASGLYYNEHAEDGKLSLIAVLRPREEPEKFVQDLKSLSSFVTARIARDLRIGSASVDEEEVQKLVTQLGAESVTDRNAAIAQLKLLGPPAIDVIKAVAKDASAAIRERANAVAVRMDRELKRTMRYSSRDSMLGAMKPKFLFRRNQRQPGRPMIEILLEPGAKTTQVNQEMSVLFGGDWKRLRLAIVDDHIVLMFGSNRKLLDKAIASVKQRSPFFAEIPSIAKSRDETGGQRVAEWHFSTWEVTPLVQRNAKLRGEPATEFSTMTFSRRKAELRTDLFMPIKELGAFRTDRW